MFDPFVGRVASGLVLLSKFFRLLKYIKSEFKKSPAATLGNPMPVVWCVVRDSLGTV